MSTRLNHYAVCFLLLVMLAVCCLPVLSSAEEAADLVTFSSFEELLDLCTGPSDGSEMLWFCMNGDAIVISEDLTIPSGAIVTFCQFEVAEGVTLSVEKDAQILASAFRVEGELYNEGTVIQQELSFYETNDGLEISAWVPGHINNKGTMILTNVFGKRNIRTFGGKLTMNETESPKEPEPTPEIDVPPTPEATETPDISGDLDGLAEKVMHSLKSVLPKVVFFLVLFAAFRGFPKKNSRQVKSGRTRPQQVSPSRRREMPDLVFDYSGEDHFQRDQRNRIAQLDDWLRNGLIDRNEYRELKRRYERENSAPEMKDRY